MNQQPTIQVGIVAAPEISFGLHGDFGSGANTDRQFRAIVCDGAIVLTGGNGVNETAGEFKFSSAAPTDSFTLKNVTIGIGFHWEQQEEQRFRGDLKLIVEDDRLRAINIIPLEDYLCSVISSEMSATSSAELLKAHAVISRSWLLAQIERSKRPQIRTTPDSPDEQIRWYDREDHTHFDVCADDHCQRYQGITKIINTKVNDAINATFGEVLFGDGEICDARFSKCCGGISENFEYIWEPRPHSYLVRVRDDQREADLPDLRIETEAEKWIRSNPPAFCNTGDKKILSQVLPGFDQATSDFYRWQVTYTQEELSTLLLKKTGIDFGEVISLQPIERGYSARLIKLKITGTKKILIIGKELEIRRALSNSHLYSSAFVVDHPEVQNGIPKKFVLTGAGWGHGAGLCQIGAAVMGERGYPYEKILFHYFKDTILKKIYSEQKPYST
ncbi:MAG: SpoIID/LytB domain-containing protein [Prolixibacteraceae bacterium]